MPPITEVKTLLNLCINSLSYVICKEALRVAGVTIICPFIELSFNLRVTIEFRLYTVFPQKDPSLKPNSNNTPKFMYLHKESKKQKKIITTGLLFFEEIQYIIA